MLETVSGGSRRDVLNSGAVCACGFEAKVVVVEDARAATGGGGMVASERLSISRSSVVHRCLLKSRASSGPESSSTGDCGGEGSLRFMERI